MRHSVEIRVTKASKRRAAAIGRGASGHKVGTGVKVVQVAIAEAKQREARRTLSRAGARQDAVGVVCGGRPGDAADQGLPIVATPSSDEGCIPQGNFSPKDVELKTKRTNKTSGTEYMAEKRMESTHMAVVPPGIVAMG